ncbi:MAG: single-stranded-DNA-specific exonuclease RecJ [Verrucomicrobiia bacterium]
MKYRWNLAPAQPLLTEKLATQFGVSRLLAQCLVNRGHSEPHAIETFLHPKLKNLADPFLLPNMEAAVGRLHQARERDELVVVFGDYDVDGVTSTTLMLEILGRLGWRVNSYLPHRFEEGYGLSREAVENCVAKHSPRLLLAVDCGSTAVESIQLLKEQGIDTIVLDHHQVSDPAPDASALVNPQLGDRFQELCSAGLAFKLAHALVKRGRELGESAAADCDIRELLDLVAMGTIADIVPLRDENRILTTGGLPRLSGTTRLGLKALKDVAQCNSPVGVYEVGFQLGPRLNAAGRLETAMDALNLLTSTDGAEAAGIARELDSRNQERQQIERGIVDQVMGDLRNRFDPDKDFAIVQGEPLWHIGVVGIVASRVLREFYRPTFILGGEGDEWRGSGRSVEGFDLAAALRECDDLLLRHGGHAMAAGVSIRPERVDEFRVRLNEIARREIKAEDLLPPLRLDAEVDLNEIGFEATRELARMEPFGQGNPSVQVIVRDVFMHQPPRTIGKSKQHRILKLSNGPERVDAIWWNSGDKPLPTGTFDLACVPEINEYRGDASVRLKVLDWRKP